MDLDKITDFGSKIRKIEQFFKNLCTFLVFLNLSRVKIVRKNADLSRKVSHK